MRCNYATFRAAGFVNFAITNTVLTDMMLGGPMVPAVLLVCDNCGFVMQHAVAMVDPAGFAAAKPKN